MGFQCGIVGLPNVGKSTIFNALTSTEVPAENYPFCTVEPNVGVVPVPDPRLDRLYEIYQPAEKIPTTLEFLDIAGLVKGASKGEGLGNQFLAQIRQVDAVAHIVRCFDDGNITHVGGKVDPAGDIETINTELYLRDMESLQKQIDRLEKPAKTGNKEAITKLDLFQRVYEHLSDGNPVRNMSLKDSEREYLRPLFLLTAKKVLYVANVSEEEILSGEPSEYTKEVLAHAGDIGAEVITLCGKLEADIAALPDDEKSDFLAEYGLKEPGLFKLIRAGYRLLHLITFFTAGDKATRAWTVREGSNAPEAAGEIHTDFQRGFIKAEVFQFEKIDEYGSEKALRDAGLIRQEGRDYVVQDGDVIFFRFNV
ncbi:MAG: redox-regulated ATPase YchF [Candidatus Marinimicrobia bacterium]|nr:redox-regulated ATPase YchF [Candidatus Neomarinimicrobiota bacterium]MCF7827845.1 redox-regulated ATPase YchF [Candidatus Neomarinimicrobiota bacterium]MCF7879400.1 redox-regulated ATPase YchF [Candidatus Neomarinimicrobiota bacterium]